MRILEAYLRGVVGVFGMILVYVGIAMHALGFLSDPIGLFQVAVRNPVPVLTAFGIVTATTLVLAVIPAIGLLRKWGEIPF